METRKFKTLVKNDHKLGKDVYVLGRIAGTMAALCKEDPANGLEFGRRRSGIGNILVTETTNEKYEIFTNVIETWYPGLCVFDYVE